jgi:hypothetical protein
LFAAIKPLAAAPLIVRKSSLRVMLGNPLLAQSAEPVDARTSPPDPEHRCDRRDDRGNRADPKH